MPRLMKRALILTLAVCVGCPLLKAGNQPDHALTLAEVLALLRTNNATLASGRSHLQAMKGAELTASLRPNPILSSSSEDFSPTNFNSSYLSTNQEFTQNVSQLIERGGKS